MKLDCLHADTCLSDYFGGHHLAYVAVPVDATTTISQLRAALHSELNQGAIAGNDARTRDDSGAVGDAWYKAAHAAIDRDVKLSKRKGKGALRPFRDIETCDDDCSESVYAYFVFRDSES